MSRTRIWDVLDLICRNIVDWGTIQRQSKIHFDHDAMISETLRIYFAIKHYIDWLRQKTSEELLIVWDKTLIRDHETPKWWVRHKGWYSLCSDRFALEHFVLTVLSWHNLYWCQICIDHHFVLAYNVLAIFELWHILFWNSFCIGLLCPGQVCTVAHFALKLILHQLIMSWTILHYGQFCTKTNFELAYYALDSFVLRLNLHWLLYLAELAVLAYLSTKLSKT